MGDVRRCLADEGRWLGFTAWIVGLLDNVTFSAGVDHPSAAIPNGAGANAVVDRLNFAYSAQMMLSSVARFVGNATEEEPQRAVPLEPQTWLDEDRWQASLPPHAGDYRGWSWWVLRRNP